MRPGCRLASVVDASMVPGESTTRDVIDIGCVPTLVAKHHAVSPNVTVMLPVERTGGSGAGLTAARMASSFVRIRSNGPPPWARTAVVPISRRSTPPNKAVPVLRIAVVVIQTMMNSLLFRLERLKDAILRPD
jgi:hypothetical protein